MLPKMYCYRITTIKHLFRFECIHYSLEINMHILITCNDTLTFFPTYDFYYFLTLFLLSSPITSLSSFLPSSYSLLFFSPFPYPSFSSLLFPSLSTPFSSLLSPFPSLFLTFLIFGSFGVYCEVWF